MASHRMVIVMPLKLATKTQSEDEGEEWSRHSEGISGFWVGSKRRAAE